MVSRTLAGSLGLKGDWAEHEAGWKPDMDDNLLWLSVIVQGRVLEQIADIPAVPAEGDVYLLLGSHATHPNELAVYDDGTWHYKTPEAGWRFYNVALSAFVRFDGALWGVDDATAAAGASGDGTIPDGVVSGCAVVYSGTGLTFALTAGTFYLGGALYAAPAQTVTLDAADATNPRIDTLYVSGSGVFDKITGTATADPDEPDIDTETQLFLMSVNVPAGATDLSGSIDDELIYDEGTEWPATLLGAHIDAASTNSPYSGATCIEATAAVLGDTIRLITATPIQFAGDGNLFMRLKSKGFWVTGRIELSWYLDGRRVGRLAGRVPIKDGSFGFDSSDTADYQLISIGKYRFYIPSDSFVDELRIRVISAGGIGFYLDDIVLQTPTDGTTIINVTSGLTQEAADARYTKRLTVETVAGAYTFVAGDAGKHKRFTNGADVLATVPADVFNAGDRIRITAAGAGKVTLDDGGAVTLNSRDTALSSAGQFSVFEIECVGSNEFDVLGDVA